MGPDLSRCVMNHILPPYLKKVRDIRVVSTEPFSMGHLKSEWDIVAMVPCILVTALRYNS